MLHTTDSTYLKKKKKKKKKKKLMSSTLNHLSFLFTVLVVWTVVPNYSYINEQVCILIAISYKFYQ